MELYFRIVLWIFFLLFSEHLQAKAAPTGTNSLGIAHLRTNVLCGDNVTLISPTNVQKPCHTAALKSFEEGLEEATNKCQDAEERIIDTLDVLHSCKKHPLQHTQTNSSECKWEKKQFADFVNDFESFIELLSTLDVKECSLIP